MKLADSNGKIFKKFNVIDVIVVLLVLAVIVAIGWKTVTSKPAVVEEEEEVALQFENADHLVYGVVCQNIPEEVAKAFRSQMELSLAKRRLMSNGEPLEGYITDCTYETGEDGLCSVYFTIEAILEKEDGICSVGTQEIRIGKGHIVKTYEIETSGTIYFMEVSKNG